MPSNNLVPTKEQQEIYDYRPLDMIITAPAGCGKTEALAYRAKGLIDRFSFIGNGRKLLIVTFTNQARDNIDERLKRYITVQQLRQCVTVCNFHGLASRIIKAHGRIIGFDDDWNIANFDWTNRVINTLSCNKTIKREVSEILQSTKQKYVTDTEVKTQLHKCASPSGDIAASIETMRIKKKIITYDDQIRIALWILQDKRVAKVYSNHFFAALVDEFQDLTPHQLNLIMALCGERVTYAGDLAQSIFSFAGADSKLTYDSIAIKGRRHIRLLKSFRSSPAVLNATNALIPITKGDPLVAAFPAHWGNGGVSSSVLFPNQHDEAKWIVDLSKTILEHCPNQRIGIIARTAFRAKEVKRCLESQNISYADWGDGLFRPKLASALRSACDLLSDQSFKTPLDLYRYISSHFATIQQIPTDELETASGWLFDQVTQFGQRAIPSIKGRIRENKGNETIATRSGIHCLTGHAGKGQQFDWVFIVGLEQGTIPFYKANTDEEIAEEARILSVMISRARIGFIATSTSFNASGRRNAPSDFLPYLTEMPGHLATANMVESWFSQADWQAIAEM
ncbi:UvrD-helicase domain-containing protein [Denitrobacterium detoxificans]|jgi:DNA helicase-2/ATP-dependent DNA helicase PcrA|uniref:UvrD-helicase domain-containing protein n=1 Tax=Denitrobacterium detoxificans TaxID=79604 RepID=UPI0026EB5C87|nr:ATP-dependent helicase [Denitrobacterium detoxificans]MBE6465998.1 ATP-dependent helicase [Denitrobacterium detoxificans]